MYYYHNTTKDILNKSDVVDFMDEYEEGDVIFKTENGNAILHKVTESELVDMKREQSDYHYQEQQMDLCED